MLPHHVGEKTSATAPVAARWCGALSSPHAVDTRGMDASGRKRVSGAETTDMKRAVGFGAGVAAVALCVGLAAGAGVAEGGTPPKADPATRPGMDQSTTGSMGHMMDKMHRIMGEMSVMNGRGMGMGQGKGMMQRHGTTQGQDSMVMAMTDGVNGLTQSMNRVMQQMQAMMTDHELTRNGTFSRDLEQMQRNMGTMMHGLNGMVHDLRQIQPPAAKKP